MKGAKFEIGQEVRIVNVSKRMVVTGISENGGYHYAVEMHGNQHFTNVDEIDLIEYSGE